MVLAMVLATTFYTKVQALELNSWVQIPDSHLLIICSWSSFLTSLRPWVPPMSYG